MNNLRSLEAASKLRIVIEKLAEKAAKAVGEPIKIMNFCGTHEYTITYYGLRSLMPKNIELIPGPGCPVCVTPAWVIDEAIRLCLDGVKVYVYGDLYKVPGSPSGVRGARSLEEARALGGNVEVTYSFLDAVKYSLRENVESVFIAVGFETTVPSTATLLYSNRVPKNLKLLVAYRLTPPIMSYVFRVHRNNPIRGVIAPGHVSTIIGAKSWSFVAEEYGIPIVVSGFEPIDVLLSIAEILKQLSQGEAKLVNEYSRVASWNGNLEAQRLMKECYEKCKADWRGIGVVENSGLRLREKYRFFDATLEYGVESRGGEELPPGCRCSEVILGLKKPIECPLFMKKCTPSTPYGPCMVSSEGACSIWARYGGLLGNIELL